MTTGKLDTSLGTEEAKKTIELKYTDHCCF